MSAFLISSPKRVLGCLPASQLIHEHGEIIQHQDHRKEMRGAFTETTAGELVHAGLLQQRGGGTLVYASRGVERVFTTRRTTAAATASR